MEGCEGKKILVPSNLLEGTSVVGDRVTTLRHNQTRGATPIVSIVTQS